MKRALATMLLVAATAGGLHLAHAATTPPPIVRLRTSPPNPAELDRLIGVFGRRITAAGDDYLTLATLGGLYLERGRLTADLASYEAAIRYLTMADSITGGERTAVPLSRALLAVHRFDRALATVAGVDQSTVESLSITVDALVGLGDLARADVALTELELRHPGEPAVMTRRAELSFLSGDAAAAAEVSQTALDLADAAGLGAPDLSFYRAVTARYLLAIGEAGRAEDLAREAATNGPPLPGPWLLWARAAAADDRLDRAIELAEHAASIVPDPATLGFLADLLTAVGRIQEAERQIDTIEAIAELGQTALRRSTTLALAEHGRDLDQALAAARQELSERHDPYAHHLMATVLDMLGRPSEAEAHARMAMSVADPAVWYRAGLIALHDGRPDDARIRLTTALEAAPAFHPLDADDARRLLEEMER